MLRRHGWMPRVRARQAVFSDEEWLTPIQIARKSEYATDKPIRKAINSGELTAARPPCRRKRPLLDNGPALRVVARGPLKTIENRRRVA